MTSSPVSYRNFGRTGLKVAPLALGAMMFGEKATLDESCAIVDRALDAGINLIDTANYYGRGRSEEVTGEALKRNGRRDQVILATKAHFPMADDDPNARGNSRRHLIAQCEASLARLRTDYIDLYQIHRPQSDIPIDETLRALDDLVRAGKIRYLGTSTFAAWQVVEALWTSKEYGLNRFVAEQPPYNLLDRRIERELLPMALTFGLAIIPWSPLGFGLLTGKYRRGQPPPAGSRFAKAGDWKPQVFDAIEALEALAATKGNTLSQFALAWVLQQPGVTAPIIGPRSIAQLEDNLKALAVEVSDADRKRVDEIVLPGGMAMPFYEADFGPHQYRV